MSTRSETSTGSYVLSAIPFEERDGALVEGDAEDSNEIKGDALRYLSHATLPQTCGAIDREGASHQPEIHGRPRAILEALDTDLESARDSTQNYPFANTSVWAPTILPLQQPQRGKRKSEVLESEDEEHENLEHARKRRRGKLYNLNNIYEEVFNWKLGADFDRITQPPSSRASSVWSVVEFDEEDERIELEKELEGILSMDATNRSHSNTSREANPSASIKPNSQSGHPVEEDSEDIGDEDAGEHEAVHDPVGVIQAVPIALRTGTLPDGTKVDEEEGGSTADCGSGYSYNGELEGFEDETDFFGHLSGFVSEAFVRSNVIDGAVDDDDASENAQDDLTSDADGSETEDDTDHESNNGEASKTANGASNGEIDTFSQDLYEVDKTAIEIPSSQGVGCHHGQEQGNNDIYEEPEAGGEEEDEDHEGEAIDKSAILAFIKAKDREGVLKVLPESQVPLKITGVDAVAAALIEFKTLVRPGRNSRKMRCQRKPHFADYE